MVRPGRDRTTWAPRSTSTCSSTIPARYVHNRMYVKRLIYDSLDWLDDGVMNYSVGATLDALDPATYPYKAEAMTYLLPYGVLGIEAERP